MLDSLFYIGIYSFGALIGAISFAAFVDRISRKAALLSSSALMLILQFAFSHFDEGLPIIVIGTFFNVAIAIFLPTLVLYATFLVARRGPLPDLTPSATMLVFPEIGSICQKPERS